VSLFALRPLGAPAEPPPLAAATFFSPIPGSSPHLAFDGTMRNNLSDAGLRIQMPSPRDVCQDCAVGLALGAVPNMPAKIPADLRREEVGGAH
jgi:hypothetical protein